jgi:hypothetical protein
MHKTRNDQIFWGIRENLAEEHMNLLLKNELSFPGEQEVTILGLENSLQRQNKTM